MAHRIGLVLGLGVLLALPALAFAQAIPSEEDLPTGPRPDSWHIFNGTAIGVNGPVLGDLLKVYRKMPWGNGESLLTSDSHWRVGSHNTITPAFSRPALMIGVSPLLIMDLDVHYGPDFYYTYKRFKSGRDNYDPQNIGDPDEYMHWFHNAQANLTLKAAVGPVALLHMQDLDWYKNNEWFFDWDVATLVKEGYFLRSRTFLATEFQPNWRFFVNYENSKSFETDFLSEVASSGFIVMYPEWNSLTVIVQMGYYLHNPDFKGLKPWAAMTMEWDFPDKE